MRDTRKHFANIGMASLAKLMSLKTSYSNTRRAVSSHSVYVKDGTSHYLQAPIRLFVLLHFFADSATGRIEGIDPDVFAEILDINTKTVSAALLKLAEGGFIHIEYDSETDLENVTILDMDKLYVKGGKGYITFADSHLSQIISNKSVNMLRLIITSLCRVTDHTLHSASKEPSVELTYDVLRKGLPSYLKPCVLRKYMEDGSSFFDIFTSAAGSKGRIRLSLKQEYDGRRLKMEVNESATRRIRDEVTNIYDKIDSINETIKSEHRLPASRWLSMAREHNIDLLSHEGFTIGHCEQTVPNYRFSNQEIRDAVRIAQDYDEDIVVRAIQLLYERYLTVRMSLTGDLCGSDFGSLSGRTCGGLLRAIVKEIVHGFSSFSENFELSYK